MWTHTCTCTHTYTMEGRKSQACRTGSGSTHVYSGSANPWEMEPLSICALVFTGMGSFLWGGMQDMRSFSSGDPGVFICFPLSLTLWLLLSGYSRRTDKPCYNCTQERVMEHLWNRATVRRQTHCLSVYHDAYPRAAWMYLDTHSTCDELAFHGPLCPQLPVCFSVLAAVLPRAPTSFKKKKGMWIESHKLIH